MLLFKQGDSQDISMYQSRVELMVMFIGDGTFQVASIASAVWGDGIDATPDFCIWIRYERRPRFTGPSQLTHLHIVGQIGIASLQVGGIGGRAGVIVDVERHWRILIPDIDDMLQESGIVIWHDGGVYAVEDG